MSRRTNEQRGRKPPDEVLWLIATASVILPIVGGGMALYGISHMMHSNMSGAWWMGGGAALVVLDWLSDIWLHRVSRDHCDEPTLNTRGARFVGRVVILDTPIEAGRGRIRLHDGWWIVEGPELFAGTKVRITAHRGPILIVERA